MLHKLEVETRARSFENPEYAEAILEALDLYRSGEDMATLYYLIKLNEYPVDIEEFMFGSQYLNRPRAEIYPEVLRYLKEINNPDGQRLVNRYTECVCTGSIGSAKTTLALYTNAYQIYLLSCFRDVHQTFGLDSTSEIVFIFQSLNATLAKDVDFQRFRAICEQSHYFTVNFPYARDLKTVLRFPHRLEVKPVGGDLGALGQNVIGGLIDEVNFMAIIEKSKRSIDRGTYNQAMTVYNSIARRRKSRFMNQGAMPGILCLVSSKHYPGEFTDVKIKEAHKDPSIYVYDKRTWEIKPPGTYSDNWFRLFIGDDTHKPQILEDSEPVPDNMVHLVMEVPEEHRMDFERDMMGALRDVAGVSTLARFPFISDVESVVDSFGKTESVLSLQECNFKVPPLVFYPEAFAAKKQKRWVHVDLGLSSDAAGVACGYVEGFMEVVRGDGTAETLPIIVFDFVLRVKPPLNGEINFAKIRALLMKLRDEGLPIEWVSFDSWQSVDSQQVLRTNGFKTGTVSVDKTGLPYDFVKGAAYDGRLRLPKHQTALHELLSLEKDPKTGKIDHTPEGCFTAETRIALANGTTPTFREVVDRYALGVVFYVYSMSKDGIVIAPACNPRMTKVAKQLVEVELDNFQVVRCTPEHLFMTLEGGWIQAQFLTPDVSLMPLYRSVNYKSGWLNYEMVWCPVKKRRILTHHLAVGKALSGMLVHHRDQNKRNNDPRNLELMARVEHNRHHGSDLWVKRRDAMKAGFNSFFANESARQASRDRINKSRKEGKLGLPRQTCSIEGCGCLANARGLCDLHYHRAARAGKLSERTSAKQNHRVLSIKLLQVNEPVYDLTVPKWENFALASGVFVHNSKDCSDAIAGVVFGLTMRREIWLSHGINPVGFYNRTKAIEPVVKEQAGDIEPAVFDIRQRRADKGRGS
jgi:hypothetical protein